MTTKKPNGRKYTLTWAGLALTVLPVAGLSLLAGFGKVTPEVSQLFGAILPPYYLAIGTLVGSFALSNGYTTGKAIDKGLST